MNFIVDAQLPLKLALELVARGHDALHTLNLPDGNRSSDAFINRLADSQDRIVVSKDADFVASHIIQSSPQRLLQISIGNFSNAMLLPLVLNHLDQIEAAFGTVAYVELTATRLIAHA